MRFTINTGHALNISGDMSGPGALLLLSYWMALLISTAEFLYVHPNRPNCRLLLGALIQLIFKQMGHINMNIESIKLCLFQPLTTKDF